MGTAIQPPPIPQPAGDLALPVRLSVARSHAFELVGNGADLDEIRTAITPQLRSDLAIAMAGLRVSCMTVEDLRDEEQEAYLAEIAGFIALTGGNGTPEWREEFISQAACDLAEIPAAMLALAIRAARKRVWTSARFVSWIFEYVADDVRRLEIEREKLTKLAAIADG
jgi:hypothetical protein